MGSCATDVDLEENIPGIKCDLQQILELITHLINNASESMDEAGGTIQVSTKSMRCDHVLLEKTYMPETLLEGMYIILEVSDTGIGMNTDTVEKIFGPFFTTKASGRGLGMAVVLGIVMGHKGGIMVKSDVGKGTTITIFLPVDEDHHSSGNNEANPAHVLENRLENSAF